mmetsp:Transcript_13737/g.31800  ORF Transcript_13737/g.31800 Transcript_13737/m.31800 type:complete len:210 (+) Transcript_13737:3809-4438(+)
MMKSFSTMAQQFSGTLSLSYTSRSLRNLSTDAMAFLAAFHEMSLGITPRGATRIITALSTSATSGGGVASAFISVKCFLSSPLSAASASITSGSAAARSRLHSSWMPFTSSACLADLSSSIVATAFCSSAIAVSCPTWTSSCSVADFFSSTTSISTLSDACRSVTWSEALRSFSRPFSRRDLSLWMPERFFSRRSLYRSIKSRKDLGVV